MISEKIVSSEIDRILSQSRKQTQKELAKYISEDDFRLIEHKIEKICVSMINLKPVDQITYYVDLMRDMFLAGIVSTLTALKEDIEESEVDSHQLPRS
jgi:uncharacterized protein (DUF488 family)